MKGRDTSMSERRQLSMAIGGLHVQLTLAGLSAATWARLLADYTLFMQPWRHTRTHCPAAGGLQRSTTPAAGSATAPTADPAIDLAIDVIAADGPPFLEPQAAASWRIETHRQGSHVYYRSYFERGWIDLSARRAALVLRPQAHPENFLRVACAWLAIEHGGLLLHASGVVREGRGYVFFGHSGAGKSTVAELSPDAAVLSDDLVWLRMHGGRVWLHGVPFRGEMQAPRTNAAAPVAGIYALEQARAHRLRPLPPLLGAARLLACTPFVTQGAEAAARVMDVCTALAQAQPISVLEFTPDGGFWPLVTASSTRHCRRKQVSVPSSAEKCES
jgi:hypothetical protein